MSILLGDIMGILGDVLGLPRPTFLWRGLNPPRYRSTQLPLMDSSALPWHKRSAVSLPPAKVSTSIWWAL